MPKPAQEHLEVLTAHLWAFVDRLRRDPVALYKPPRAAGGKGAYVPRTGELTEHDLGRHLTSEQPLGLYTFQHELGPKGQTLVGILDLDDKAKKLTLEELGTQGLRLAQVLAEQHGLEANAYTSGSGHGLHLWLLFTAPVDAQALRTLLKQVVKEAKTTCHVDIFPAQDRVEDGVGSLVALPLSRGSRPVLSLAPWSLQEDLSSWAPPDPRLTTWREAGVPSAELEADEGLGGAYLPPGAAYGPVDLVELEQALSHVSGQAYNEWYKVGMALKAAEQAGQVPTGTGERLWQRWSQKDPRYNERQALRKWASFRPNGSLTLGTVWRLAKDGGYTFPPKAVHLPRAGEHASLAGPGVAPAQLDQASWQDACSRLPWLAGHELPPELRRLNDRYFVAPEGGKTFVFHQDHDDTLDRRSLVRFAFADFTNLYRHHRVVLGHDKRGNPITETLGKAWLDSPGRRQYDKVVMDPSHATPPWVYNLWQGFAVTPSPTASCSRLKDHVLINVCGADRTQFDYIWRWCAHTVQHPGEQIGVAIVMRGGKGVGKGTLGRALGLLFGQHFMQTAGSRDLTSRFNSHLQDCVFLFADEAIWAGSKTEESVLKSLITEPYLNIEGKGRDMVTAKNMLHIMMATNSDWAIPAGLDERRFMAVRVSDAHQQDHAYFDAIWHQLTHEDGLGALLHELQTLDLSGFRPAQVPATDELLIQKLRSLESVASWWYGKLKLGVPLTGFDWTDDVPLQGLYYDYVAECRLAGDRYPGAMEAFATKLNNLMHVPQRARKRLLKDLDTPLGVIKRGQMLSYLRLNPLQACREYFERLAKAKIIWEYAPSVLQVEDGPLAESPAPTPSQEPLF